MKNLQLRISIHSFILCLNNHAV